MSELLKIQNLKKYFKTPKGDLHAVDGVSFTVKKGETLGVVGESGCGKSTLGRCIVHLLDTTDGKIYFEDKNITNVSGNELKELRKDLQMIFQDPFSSINPRMTVKSIIIEPIQIHHMYEGNKEKQEKAVLEIMDTVGLARRLADSYPHELDGGRRQRIGIARALALNPKFIVCDEPVSALDVSIQAQILNLMQDLQEEKGLTYIFITHDLSVVKHISDNICVMYLGTLVEKCSSELLFKKQLHPYTQALLSAIPVAKINSKKNRIILKGEIVSPISPAPGCRFAPRCLYAKDECFILSPELKEFEPEHFVACHLY
ncbi:ATP-binding cassette domain-containing protein [Sedimentibacter hydroxybenzoicus DSM 7310]|uniref:ATP-binding cassette domain-containing protein n=1 Tax=Sedimentibacter hydroxybenzoicus DSM 7310 TaxID=1123245 RepID=A0A974BGZ9_SEDHY|nr:oligopeptide/dipeptide ABC transporter ATP-binding protein [Sedimentibacter hydroxybenzoicus]NYB73004.1 ATP-binding cassette domain-containing protein [Sedimentibacter hydroxybenzoicus DSM 7310]